MKRVALAVVATCGGTPPEPAAPGPVAATKPSERTTLDIAWDALQVASSNLCNERHRLAWNFETFGDRKVVAVACGDAVKHEQVIGIFEERQHRVVQLATGRVTKADLILFKSVYVAGARVCASYVVQLEIDIADTVSQFCSK